MTTTRCSSRVIGTRPAPSAARRRAPQPRSDPRDAGRRRPLVRLFRELPQRSRRQYPQTLITVLRPAFEHTQRVGSLCVDLEPADLALLFEMHEAALVAGPAPPERAKPAERLVRGCVTRWIARSGAGATPW